jgi:hypothetical protein
MELIIEAALLFLGIGFLGTGLQHRREDGPRDGVVGILAGSALLAALGLLLVGSALVAGNDDAPAADGITSDDGTTETQLAVEGADRYLRGVDRVRLTGKADGVRVEMTFIDDADAAGTFRTDDVTLRLLRVDGASYLKVSDSFWDSAPDPAFIAEFVDGRWIRLDEHDTRFTALTDVPTRDEIRASLVDPRRALSKPARIHGVDCLEVRTIGGRGRLWIARSPDRLIRIDDGRGFIGDVDYDAPEVTPHRPARVVDGSEVFETLPTT